MGHIFSHVTRSDRITIEAMLKAGSSRKEIAEKIGGTYQHDLPGGKERSLHPHKQRPD